MSTEEGLLDALRTDAKVYEVAREALGFPMKTAKDLMEEVCPNPCKQYCNAKLSEVDIWMFRGVLVQSINGPVTRSSLDIAIFTVLSTRTDLKYVLDGVDPKFVEFDASINGKEICRSKFLDVIGISWYHNILDSIATGQTRLSLRKGAFGDLGDNTCRALARVAAYSAVHGQYSPLDGKTLLLGRAASKCQFLRANGSGSVLSKKMLREFVGLSIKRRCADDFMHCDVCVTLGQQWKRVSNLVRIASKPREPIMKITRAGTAVRHRNRLRIRRKATLFALMDSDTGYKAKRADIAARKKIPVEEISLDEVVPDEDVQMPRYLELANSRHDAGLKPPLKPFKITSTDVLYNELADMDDDAIELWLSGAFNEYDLVKPPENGPVCTDEQDPRPADWDGAKAPVESLLAVSADGEDGDGDLITAYRELAHEYFRMDVADPLRRRRLCILSTAERVMKLRQYHNEHIVAERLMCYGALEASATSPTSFLVLLADGLSKDKSKIPRRCNRSKEDPTVTRHECHVTGIQMAIPGPIDRGQYDRTAVMTERARREQLREMKMEMRRKKKAGEDVSEERARDIEDGEKETTKKDVDATSSFRLVNHDFLFPFGWGGSPRADALVSNVLHLLSSKHVAHVPPVLALIVDNATSNKSMGALYAFGLLLELIPCIQEIHIMFCTVGHTHNSVDAHFGILCDAMKRVDIGTPIDLANCFETVSSTHAHLDFPYYQFTDKLKDMGGVLRYKWILDQHYFLLFRNSAGDVKFNNKSFLRFAEPFSNRLMKTLTTSRFLPRTSIENEAEGNFLFVEGEFGRASRAKFAKTVLPRERDPALFKSSCAILEQQLKRARMDSDERTAHLARLCQPDDVTSSSLYDLCAEINSKAPRVSTNDDLGVQQEIAIHQHMRLLGRTFKYNHLQIEALANQKSTMTTFAEEFFDMIGDDRALTKSLLDKIDDKMSFRTKKRLSTVLDSVRASLEADEDYTRPKKKRKRVTRKAKAPVRSMEEYFTLDDDAMEGGGNEADLVVEEVDEDYANMPALEPRTPPRATGDTPISMRTRGRSVPQKMDPTALELVRAARVILAAGNHGDEDEEDERERESDPEIDPEVPMGRGRRNRVGVKRFTPNTDQ